MLTYAKDRSETTRKRAETVGVECVPSMGSLVKDADLIVSIVVPFAAKRVAGKVAKAAVKTGRKDLLYLDANAISPMTADEIGKLLEPSGIAFVLMGARGFGLLDEILKRYEESFPGLLDKVTSSIVGLRVHAARRAEEMDELKRTFNHHGMKNFMAPAVQKVLQSIAALDVGKASDSGAREGDLLDTLELFFQKGLLQEQKVSPSKEPIHAAG